MKISQDVKLDFDDVLIRPKRSTISSRADVDVMRSFETKYGPLRECFPLIVANMDTTGTFAMARALKEYGAMVALHKFYSAAELSKNILDDNLWNTFITIGQSEQDLVKLYDYKRLSGMDPWLLNIDVANGYTEAFVSHVKRVRDLYPHTIIMAGNVCTPEMTEQLILCGVSLVKLQIGPGSQCTTRLKTGVGYGTLSTVLECKDAAHGLGGLVCSDGGIRTPGDAAKGFCAGADFLMVGGLFAGVDECEGEWEYENSHYISKESLEDTMAWSGIDREEIDKSLEKFKPYELKTGKKSLKFYGMSSKEAQEKHNGGLAKHRAAEGKCSIVPYKGPATDVLLDIMGGVRSCGAYIGARKLKDFDKCGSFVRVNRIHGG